MGFHARGLEWLLEFGSPGVVVLVGLYRWGSASWWVMLTRGLDRWGWLFWLSWAGFVSLGLDRWGSSGRLGLDRSGLMLAGLNGHGGLVF